MTSLLMISKKPDLIKSFTEIQPIADMGKGKFGCTEHHKQKSHDEWWF